MSIDVGDTVLLEYIVTKITKDYRGITYDGRLLGFDPTHYESSINRAWFTDDDVVTVGLIEEKSEVQKFQEELAWYMKKRKSTKWWWPF